MIRISIEPLFTVERIEEKNDPLIWCRNNLRTGEFISEFVAFPWTINFVHDEDAMIFKLTFGL